MRRVNASVHAKTIMARVMASALMMTAAWCVRWSLAGCIDDWNGVANFS